MRLVFAGTPEPAVVSLEALLASGHEVVAVLTRPDAGSGRGRQVSRSPVAALAAEAGLELLQPRRLRDPQFLDRLRVLAPDCCPVVAYGGLIPAAALDVPPRGWVNLHFSLLPAWRGAAPVQHALMAGDELTGASTFQITEGLDEGPVFGMVTEPIGQRDTAGDLLGRLALSGAQLLVATVDAIADGSAVSRPQPDDGVSWAPKITVDDTRVDWLAPALRVDRVVRASTPAPGAWCLFRGDRLKLHPVELMPGRADLGPGEIGVDRQCVRVGTGSHEVALGAVQPPGKRAMPATDWARGARLQPGESFE